MKRPFKKIAYLILVSILLGGLLAAQAAAQDTGMVRVYLKRLKIADTIRIQVEGSYMLDGGAMTFSDGAQISVVLSGDQLVLHTQGMAVVMGDEIRLLRCQGEKEASLLIDGSSGRYEGDLMLDIDDGVIRPILHIHVEDYLLGVVPYEMGDSFPLEALKAQAIAARTYVLNQRDAQEDYDVEDTTNDQAYKGRSSSSPLSEQAVRETAGLVGTYNGKLAQCYYSASNGGQTELGQHVWPDDDPDAYGYMDMRDDPYDYENDASSVKRYTIKKKPGQDGVGAALHTELVAAMASQLAALGYEAQDDLVRIDEIKDIRTASAKYSEPSRLMTELVFELKVSVRDCLFRDETPVQTQVTPEPGETPSPTNTPSPTATPAYSSYRKLGETFIVTLPIFTNAEKAMGLSINLYQNELITVMDIGSAFVLESRRYGHGVGMSQRGAEQMAGKYVMTCSEILAFYYPRMELALSAQDRAPLPTIDAQLMATPAPTASPTPRPTLMPVTAEALPEGAYIAVVSNIDDDSSLNLRKSPSLSSDILRRLYKHQRLVVLSVSRDGWAHVKTDVIEGYVKSEYLQTAEKE